MSAFAIEPPRLPLSARPCPHCALPLEWSRAAGRWMEYTTGSPHWCPVARVALRTFPLPETAEAPA